MEIAKGINSTSWNNLDLSPNNPNEWDKAINILSKRINARYIEPIEILIENEMKSSFENRRFGFTILSIDCMLIETLQSFYDGVKTTNNTLNAFTKFLNTSIYFKAEFSNKIKGIPIAKIFYYDFRCGLLHQTEVSNGGKIWSIGPLANIVQDELIINRSEFHNRLKMEINNYLNKLREPENIILRKNFIKKMDYISKNPNPRYI